MNKKKLISAVLTLAFGAVSVSSAVLTVSKNGGMFNTVQAAVDAARAGDEIIINDLEIYEEQVTFENKRELTLSSKNPASLDKPIIRYFDDENVGPTTCAESENPEKIEYDRNGAVRVIGSENIVIEGLSIDGEKPNPFAYPSVWDCKVEHFTGNAAFLLNSSSSVVVRNCEMRNAYYGVYVVDANMAQIIESSNSGIVDPLTVGGHLLEHNRIYDNSWGVYTESVRGVGSTFRFNLIYSNFHSEEVLSTLSNLPGNDHQLGGAFVLKDNYIVPLAIHNNTFWNNYQIITGHWKPGGQHLIFNNIYGKPKFHWSDGYQPSDEYRNPWQSMDDCFPNRSKNCLYAAQAQAPQTRSQVYEISCLDRDTTITGVDQVIITNEISDKYVVTDGATFEFEHPEGGTCGFTVPWIKNPGALISDPQSFPEEAQMRWFEVEFLSTDPSSPDFLKPDRNDTFVQDFIENEGWAVSGIVNAENANSDIGAVQSGGYPCGSMMVRPNSYFDYDHQNDTADLSFTIESDEDISDLEIKYLNLVSDAPVQSNDAFGSNIDPVAASAIHSLTIPSTPLQLGDNTLQLQLPSSLGEYAFIEMLVGGVNGDGKPVISNVSFIPFRQSIYKFTVDVYDSTGTEKVSSLMVGSKAVLKVTSEVCSEVFENTLNGVQVSCRNSGEYWSIDSIISQIIDTVHFTKAGTEIFTLSGAYDSPSMGEISFHGVSENVTVTTDQVSDIEFISPVSDRGGELSLFPSGVTIPMSCLITDEFGNPNENGPVSVTFETLDSDIAVVSEIREDDGSSIKVAEISIKEDAAPGDTFRIVATLDANGTSDTVACVVGDPSSPVRFGQKITTSQMLSIQVVDLRGRTVDRFTGSMSQYRSRLKNMRTVRGKGMFIMKITDLENGKTSVRRFMGGKELRNSFFRMNQ
ncbi:MAG: hypothetical protein ACLFQB_06855 [Chitinispirillaceae bacterium]